MRQSPTYNSSKFDIIIPPQDIASAPGLQTKLADGDSLAFAWVYKNYCKRLYQYIYLITMHEQTSEDLVQDVFCKLWHNREKLHHVDNFNGYLFTLARNEAINHFRHQEMQQRHFAQYIPLQTASCNAVNDYIDHKQTREIIDNAINELPAKLKDAFLLKEQGMSRIEIAEAMGHTRCAVKSYISRVKETLKRQVTS